MSESRPRSGSANEPCRIACDSLVALGNATADGAVLFAKNSDRPAFECQPLVQVPRGHYDAGARVRCQYLDLPQVRQTARLVGSRPYWLWGFEHGLNEHGVAIGNHTVFTKEPLPSFGLIGMDLVRLGLERAAHAEQAVTVITELIERHGQGGSGYADRDWPYHNSFLIADPHAAFLLETSDRHWAVRRIDAVGSASNHLSIGSDWHALAPHTAEHAVAAGWWPVDAGRLDFAAAYRDTSIAPPVISSGRHRRTCELLAAGRGHLTPTGLCQALRDHYGAPLYRRERLPDDEHYFSVCMHADPVGTTTASMVARLTAAPDDLLRYWGAFGTPCVGVFLPYYLDGELPDILSRGGREPDADSPWWRFRELLTLVEGAGEAAGLLVRSRWDEIESAIAARAALVEADAIALRRKGQAAAAAAALTRFMADNVSTMEQVLDDLIARLRPA
jgi:dipeptidase